MRKKKSEFLGASGTMWEIWKALVNEILSLGGGDDELRLIQTNGDLRRRLAELIMACAKKDRNIFKLTVDCRKSLAEAIEAGKYDWVSSNITQNNFPYEGEGTCVDVAVELFHFGKVMSTKDVLSEIEKQGYRPAGIRELLALGSAQPELQRQFPIIALGSVWFGNDGSRSVPFLCGDDVERNLHLDRLECAWSGGCRFAVVRELS